MLNKFILVSCLLLLISVGKAQDIQGVVLEKALESKLEIPVLGANVFWLDTSEGVVTNEEGVFSLPQSQQTHFLVISHVGFVTDTLHVHSGAIIRHVLRPDNELNEIVVTTTQQSLKKSFLNTINTSEITSKELLKAACCNLSESFETNPSIDVSYSDAITGNKQIKMLGLTSPYILVTEENVPSLRGASQAYGMSFTPGTWLESVQITKGAGSVINGYESISGQINTELLKSINDIPFYLNVYGSTDSRYELNTHFNKKINPKLAASLFLHGNTRVQKNDMNGDGFMDNPLVKQINLMNRWQYVNAEKGWVSFVNLRYMNDEKQTGQLGFDPDLHNMTTLYWGAVIQSERVDVSSKVGYAFVDQPYKSFGLQTAYTNHKQDSYYGLRNYNIGQQSIYSNLIYKSILSNTKNKFTTGVNYMSDRYNERFTINNYSRLDRSVGAFFEYSYKSLERFSMVLGARIDHHTRLGSFVTPRVHLRYVPWQKSVLRLSGGRGKRLANIFAENQNLMASSRGFQNMGHQTNQPYGLNPEIAWNYGLSFLQDFKFLGKDTQIGIDWYQTDFKNKVVVDLYASSQAVLFYDLKGRSTASSMQVDFRIEPIKHLIIRSSYKLYDSKTDYSIGTYQTPLQAPHRFFTNLEFKTHSKEKGRQWRFDGTYNWVGRQNLPYIKQNTIIDGLPKQSNPYSLVNIQVTRTFSSVFELYVGGENITDYQQANVIVDSENPFGSFFDSSIVYGPIFGAMYYVGIRFKVK